MQRTLKQPIRLAGTGLHSGRPVRLCVLPAAAGYGIRFRRADVTDRDNMIPALWNHVTDTRLCTSLGNSAGVEISTVEHLMAALAGCGIYNALVEVDGPELPIMDGSSGPFVAAILGAGVQVLDTPMRAIRLLGEVSVAHAGVSARLLPSDTVEIAFAIDFDEAAIGRQSKVLDMANGTFVRELSDCRTFCRRRDIERIQAAGRARGGDLGNAIVVDGPRVLNPGGFRRADECVRHKMLDAFGDLALAGAPLVARYEGTRAGHRITNLLLRALFARPSVHEMTDCGPAITGRLPGAHILPEDFVRL
ncbi:MAG: UDP-3-O-acyl-N-acetylglucosamine deacetylase [Rhodobacteraceae bacterium]|nr:UDP-3-O-acyl-N-acetylglucosamine deacetylase [Paracoccaceae bacterium]